MEYVKFRYFGTIIYVNIIEISDLLKQTVFHRFVLGGHIEDRFLRFDPHVTAKNEMVK